jgi:hypothetical protein
VQPFALRDLQELVGGRPGPCVSVYAPAHARPDGWAEDRIRWKDLLDDAMERLAAVAPSPRAARRILAPLGTIEEAEFRQGGRGGLAAFAADGFARVHRVPMELPERIIVADSFHVRPLLRWLQGTSRYYVLAVSKRRVRVFEGVPGFLWERQVPGMPSSIEDVATQAKSRHPSGFGLTHGHVKYGLAHGGPRSPDAELAPFVRAIDDALAGLLRDEQVPVVLAGVERIVSAYRRASRYPALADEALVGNIDRAQADAIREAAEPIAQSIDAARHRSAADEYQRLVGSFKATDDLRLVGKAAVEGRVRRLLLARGKIVRGALDGRSGEVRKRGPREQALGDDLGDDLAEAVLLRGGQVLTLEPKRMPTDQPVAAILRW